MTNDCSSEISAQEQFAIYTLNRARANFAEYIREAGIRPEYGAPVPVPETSPVLPPLAPSPQLRQAACRMAKALIEHRTFGHDISSPPEDVSTPNERILAAGYPLDPAFFDRTGNNRTESWSLLGPDPRIVIRGLIIDSGFADAGHRLHMLLDRDKEVGVAVVSGAYVINTGFQSSGDRFVTGVVYEDRNGAGYTLGTGLAGVRVAVGNLETTTNAGGGYSLKLPGQGSFTITVDVPSSTGGSQTISSTVPAGAGNVEVDFFRAVGTAVNGRAAAAAFGAHVNFEQSFLRQNQNSLNHRTSTSADGSGLSVLLNNDVALDFIRVPAGTATLENGATANVPDFFILKGAATARQVSRIAGVAQTQEGDFPASMVSRDDARLFAGIVGATIGQTCRLPSEAEWVRAGATSANQLSDLPTKVPGFSASSPPFTEILEDDFSGNAEGPDRLPANGDPFYSNKTGDISAILLRSTQPAARTNDNFSTSGFFIHFRIICRFRPPDPEASNGNGQSQVRVERPIAKIAVRRGNLIIYENRLGVPGLAPGEVDSVTFGDNHAGDEYLAGDWTGNGLSKLAVRRGNQLVFQKRLGITGLSPEEIGSFGFGDGDEEDQYLVGDWTGDGVSKLAVRRENLIVYQKRLGVPGLAPGEVGSFAFGNGSGEDQYLVGDWTGDGISKLAVRRGNLIIFQKRFGVSGLLPGEVDAFSFGNGNTEDQYLVGDWTGDGISKFAVRRGNLIIYQKQLGVPGLSPGEVGVFAFGNGSGEDQYLSGAWT